MYDLCIFRCINVTFLYWLNALCFDTCSVSLKAVLHNKMRSSSLKIIYCSIPQYTCDTIPTWLHDTVQDIVSNAEFVVVLTAVLTSYLQQSAVTIIHMYMLSGYYTFVFYRWLQTRTHVKLINARNHFVPRFTEVPLC